MIRESKELLSAVAKARIAALIRSQTGISFLLSGRIADDIAVAVQEDVCLSERSSPAFNPNLIREHKCPPETQSP